jgi:hypothetical protein
MVGGKSIKRNEFAATITRLLILLIAAAVLVFAPSARRPALKGR